MKFRYFKAWVQWVICINVYWTTALMKLESGLKCNRSRWTCESFGVDHQLTTKLLRGRDQVLIASQRRRKCWPPWGRDRRSSTYPLRNSLCFNQSIFFESWWSFTRQIKLSLFHFYSCCFYFLRFNQRWSCVLKLLNYFTFLSFSLQFY